MPRRPDGSSAIECVAGGLEEETNVAARLDRGRVDTATGTVTVTQHSCQAVGSRRMRIVSRLTKNKEHPVHHQFPTFKRAEYEYEYEYASARGTGWSGSSTEADDPCQPLILIRPRRHAERNTTCNNLY